MLFGMNRRKKETYEEPNYWISFSDFAISFLISFILLSSLILAYQYNQKLKTEEMANKLAASIVDIQETYAVRANIAKKLKEVFKDDLNVYVDEVSGTVTLKENVPTEQAKEIEAKLKEAGATVELK